MLRPPIALLAVTGGRSCERDVVKSSAGACVAPKANMKATATRAKKLRMNRIRLRPALIAARQVLDAYNVHLKTSSPFAPKVKVTHENTGIGSALLLLVFTFIRSARQDLCRRNATTNSTRKANCYGRRPRKGFCLRRDLIQSVRKSTKAKLASARRFDTNSVQDEAIDAQRDLTIR